MTIAMSVEQTEGQYNGILPAKPNCPRLLAASDLIGRQERTNIRANSPS